MADPPLSKAEVRYAIIFGACIPALAGEFVVGELAVIHPRHRLWIVLGMMAVLGAGTLFAAGWALVHSPRRPAPEPPPPAPVPPRPPLPAEEQNRRVLLYLGLSFAAAVEFVIISVSASKHWWGFLVAASVLAPPVAAAWWRAMRRAREVSR